PGFGEGYGGRLLTVPFVSVSVVATGRSKMRRVCVLPTDASAAISPTPIAATAAIAQTVTAMAPLLCLAWLKLMSGIRHLHWFCPDLRLAPQATFARPSVHLPPGIHPRPRLARSLWQDPHVLNATGQL